MSRILSTDYAGSLCEIRTSDNCLLGMGKIADVSFDDSILIEKRGDDLPCLAVNATVKVGIANFKLGSMFLTAKVYTSTDSAMKIKEIFVTSESEKRKAFRLNYSALTNIYKDNERPPAPALETIELVNISLTGFLCKCKHELPTNDQYLLALTAKDKVLFLNFVIVREIDTEDKFHNYGCMFYNVDGKTEDKLLFFLQEIQREDIRKVKKSL